MIPPETSLNELSFDQEVHGLIVDTDLITQSNARKLRKRMGTLPLVLVENYIQGDMGDRKAGEWIGNGVSDVFFRATPAALMCKRLGALVQLYCMNQSIHGQTIDRLTGLYTREAFFHFAKEMINLHPDDEYAMIISDIENFKRINERLGEEQGDTLLKFVGHTLGTMNSEDILFARYGGDQFVGLMRCSVPGMKIDQDYLEEGMRRFYSEVPVEHISVQFGIYENVDKTLPVSIMCDRTLMALKTIKHQYGRKYGKYTAQLQQRFNRKQQILDSMEEAIQNHQLIVYYQPKHDTATSAVIGAEALVRWNHPVYGFMSPAEFIPLFEKSGFITRMDEYIWKQVCLDIKNLMSKGLPVVPVSINVSRKDLATERFISGIKNLLDALELDPGLFHMELTESVYMEDAEILAPMMEELRSIGIKIELDDFGSGYSSLGILSKLPVDIIKLDISLIRNLETQPVIVESIIKLMNALGYETTAEGVESENQAEMLKKMGCSSIQGYYYSKPLTLIGFCEYIAGMEKH